ncbi:ARID/BRIGHT DNA-binding domain-containing protein [Actinidia rufa]|uniref:ARID/BRIGHT DNA-binding domain-containing protein n=1 Tax=Actinidia rufa TaxID=165716 RepID=A0A7J0F9A5_9ERIC|nr:ARID/BRIGHT DNA-binding domain-containing protein [Actinidia rufa]
MRKRRDTQTNPHPRFSLSLPVPTCGSGGGARKRRVKKRDVVLAVVVDLVAVRGRGSGVQQASGSGRARRDAAARAMQGWHSQRLLGNGEVGDPIIKDKNSTSTPKREKQLKTIGLLKRKKPSPVEHAVKAARMKASKAQSDTMVVDIGHAADWVKINVQRTRDCFEVYALVPGLLREEVG